MYFKLLKCLREYKKYAILTPIFVGIESVLDMFIPFFMAFLIDEGINKGNSQEILRYGAILMVIILFAMLFGILSGKYAAKASAGFAKNLRKDMFYNVQTFSFENIDKFSTASIITRHTTDINNVQHAVQMMIRVAIRSFVTLFTSLILALLINVKVAIIFLVAIPILGGGLLLITHFAHPLFEKTFKIYDRLNNIVEENIRGIRVVKSFVTEDEEIEKFNGISKDIFTNFTKAEKLVALNHPLMQFTMNLIIICLALIGGKLIVVGDLTTGELTSMFSYAMQVLSGLMMLSMVFVMILISRASAERISEILAEKSSLTNNEKAIKVVKDGSIEFDNVDFSYVHDESRTCLSGIDLKIKSGETIGIIGGTGSSKSTLVQLIPRLYDATQGEVKVGGINVKDYDLESL